MIELLTLEERKKEIDRQRAAMAEAINKSHAGDVEGLAKAVVYNLAQMGWELHKKEAKR